MKTAFVKIVLSAALAVSAPAAVAAEETKTVSRPYKAVASRDFVKDSAIYYGSIWAFRFFYVRNKNERIFDTSFSKWFDHITEPPVKNDGDSFFTNYVVHPFAGYVSYLYYRQMGYGIFGSALGSALQSTLFEYTVEGLVETPSLPDLLSTPGLGVVVGFAAENISDFLIERNNPVTTVLAHAVNPMRNFVNNRRVALINPLQGRFEYTQSFDISNVPWKNLSVQKNSPVSFESALPRGYAGGRLEVTDLKGGGQLIFYGLRAELPSSDYSKSAYIFFKQSGVNNLPNRKPRDGYELSNFLLGGKMVVVKKPSYWVSLGFESHLPVIYKDNIKRLKRIAATYRRDLPVYLEDAYSLSPFAGAAIIKWPVSVETRAGFIFLGKAKNFEGDKSENIVQYGTALSFSLPVKPAVKLSAEITGNRFLSLRKGKKDNLYFTSAIRFGSFISPSVALTVPISGSDSDVVSKSVVAQIEARF